MFKQLWDRHDVQKLGETAQGVAPKHFGARNVRPALHAHAAAGALLVRAPHRIPQFC